VNASLWFWGRVMPERTLIGAAATSIKLHFRTFKEDDCNLFYFNYFTPTTRTVGTFFLFCFVSSTNLFAFWDWKAVVTCFVFGDSILRIRSISKQFLWLVLLVFWATRFSLYRHDLKKYTKAVGHRCAVYYKWAISAVKLFVKSMETGQSVCASLEARHSM